MDRVRDVRRPRRQATRIVSGRAAGIHTKLNGHHVLRPGVLCRGHAIASAWRRSASVFTHLISAVSTVCQYATSSIWYSGKPCSTGSDLTFCVERGHALLEQIGNPRGRQDAHVRQGEDESRRAGARGDDVGGHLFADVRVPGVGQLVQSGGWAGPPRAADAAASRGRPRPGC